MFVRPKSTLFFLFCFFTVHFISAQQADFVVTAEDDVNETDVQYNKWSIEPEFILNRATRPFESGYYAATLNLWGAGIGTRYMINEKFGVKLHIFYDQIVNQKHSLEFENSYYGAGLQGVVNAGNLLNFRKWTQRLNFNVHAGVGIAQLAPGKDSPYEKADNIGYLVAGITPQLKLSNKVVLTGTVDFLSNIRQHYTWDVTTTSSNYNGHENGLMMHVSLGVTVYLGKNKEHLDWYVKNDNLSELEGRVNSLAGEVSGIKTGIEKIGKDIESQQVDFELYKGSQVHTNNTTAEDVIRELLDKGYVSVYFDFDSSTPEQYSLNAVNYLATYLRDNPGRTAEAIGYADAIGTNEYNLELSQARADKVKELLMAVGIDGSRISTRGAGIDESVDISSEQARQIVRRVVFKIK